MEDFLICESETNSVFCGENSILRGKISGEHNVVYVGSFKNGATINLQINGSNNVVYISESDFHINLLDISVGNPLSFACNTSLFVGTNFQCTDARFFLYNPSNKLFIGNDCMFSQGITIRCGEIPHLIFDRVSCNFLDNSDGVFIGNHCWIGWCAYINKRSAIPDNCIVGAQSVVTHKFTTPNSIIAGNPAKEVKHDVDWFKDINCIDAESHYYKRFVAYVDRMNFFSRPRFIKSDYENDQDFIEAVKCYLLDFRHSKEFS